MGGGQAGTLRVLKKESWPEMYPDAGAPDQARPLHVEEYYRVAEGGLGELPRHQADHFEGGWCGER